MKKSLSPGAIAGVSVGVLAILVLVGVLLFKPSFGPGPVVQPKPFSPPGGAAARFGTHGAPSSAVPPKP